MNFFKPRPRIKRLPSGPDEVFLASRGPLWLEFFKIIRIAFEFARGFRAMAHLGPAVTVFGSARFRDGHPYYELARHLGKLLGSHHWTVITGGGPGLMQGANQGAFEVGARSVGCNIRLPMEQEPNPFLTQSFNFYYFFVRKVMLVKYSCAYICLPGGLGTLDELSEALTLIQTGKVYNFPVILVGVEYWKGLTHWFQETLLAQGAIDKSDLNYFHVVDTPEEVIALLKIYREKISFKNRA